MPGVAMHEVERTPTHCRHTTPGMKRDTTDESIIVRYSPQADVVTNRMDSNPYVQPKSDGMGQPFLLRSPSGAAFRLREASLLPSGAQQPEQASAKNI
jgi:hypothetical protein